ncbi:APC family permease [Salmonella enterica]|uniref:APC family permease n=1 Tax=Salmonella enterica TaxID=28901 RepID=UPI0008A81A76|nr:APC family permease [Salmonella enterica]EAW1191067.1 APC family permease [Salmonella enterica subsp. enterica]EAW9004812.1 APC family permease [Salmonella enterica]EAY5636279.1 APC family permease [Salmonella enterica]EBP3783600.1 APC family permease [Salmonella enterica subsp. enterica]EBP3793097.1 APC family permease [Salmonella enterica subsp. enterica]
MKKVKKLSLTDLVLYGLVFMVPIAPVSLYGVVYNLSHGMVALVYIIGAIAMFFTAYSYSTLSQHISSSGSAYAYAGVCINPAAGFLTGWILLLDYLLFPTLVAVLGGVAVHAILPQIPVWVWPLIYVAIGTGINYLGIQQTAKFDKLLVVIQLSILAIFVLLIVRLMMLDSSQITLLALVLATVLFIIVVAFAAFATGNVDRFAEGNATNEAFFTIAGNVGGIWLKVAFSIIVAFVCAVGNIITAQTAVSRVLFSMGRDRMLPAFLAHIHTTRKTPDYAILFTGGVTLLLSYLFSGKIESISTLVNFGALFAFFVVNLCVFILFNFRMKAQRRIFAHVISPIMGMIVIGYVCLNMNIHALILGISWAAIGIAILCYRKAHNQNIAIDLEGKKLLD